MADDGSGTEVQASLARLRLFLAPHKSSRNKNEDQLHDKKPAFVHADPNSSDSYHDEASNLKDATEDLSSELSTLAEQFFDTTNEDIRLNDAGQEELTENQPPEDEAMEATGSLAVANSVSVIHHEDPLVGSVATVSPINACTKEYARVKYLLQCSLPAFRLSDDMVMWDMKNPALQAQYESRSAGLLELDFWVEVDHLSAAMGSLQDNELTGGAVENRKPMAFASGNIPLDSLANKKGRKQIVLCKIAVGRSFVVQSEDEAMIKSLPPGYHSYYVSAGQNSSGESAHSYHHEYLVNDVLQILPQYLVRFSFSAVEAKASNSCALCEKHSAIIVCKACDAELCKDCDHEVHSANKLVERHKRVPKPERENGGRGSNRKPRRVSSTVSMHCDILESDASQSSTADEYLTDQEADAIIKKQLDDSLTDFEATCQLHEGKKIEFYCPICPTPVCVNCKMVGDHSVGEKGSHRLLSIADAYERSLWESFKTDPLVDSRKAVIGSKIALISQWKNDIARNRAQVETAIKQQYEQALACLDEEARKKTCVLEGEELELKRQAQQIEWLDGCLDQQRTSCSIVDFLSTWSQHKILRAEQRDFPVCVHAPLGGEQVKADLQLVGNLQVIAGEQVLPRLSFVGSDFDDQFQDDHCGTLPPRGSIGGVSSPPVSVRRTSENEIRRKLLSMRSMDQHAHDRVAAPSPSKTFVGMGTLSPQGRKMMDEIRSDLFAQRTVRANSETRSPSLVSPVLKSATPSAPLRAYSLHSPRIAPYSSPISAPSKQRVGTAAWTALLRHELAVSKETRSEVVE